jgi:hypothetical protein
MPILNPHGLGLSDAVDSYLETQRKAKEEAAMAAIGQMMAGDLGAAPAASASPSPVFAPGAAQPAPSGPKLPTFAGVEGSAPSGNIRGLIANAAQKYGQDPNTLTRIAGVESSFNPSAKNPNSSAAGLFQFTSGTAKAYGLADPFNPAASADAAARLTRDNGEHLASTLGRAPTPGELYLAHQQGAGGAAKLLANPNARAGDIVGDAAVALNGGNPNMPAGQFAARWTRKFDGDKPIQPVVAQSDLPASNAQTAQGFAVPGQAAPVASVAASPNDAKTRQMIGAMMQVPSMRAPAMALWASIRKGEDTWELGDFGAAGKGFYNKRNPSQRMMIPGSAKMEGYTLGENQARYDGANNLVAQGPAKAGKLHNVPPGGVALDEDNQPVFRNPKEPPPLSVSDKKAILEADDAVLSGQSVITDLAKAKELSKTAYAGPLAGTRGYATSLFGVKGGEDTSELDKVVTGSALSQLKAIFGAAPTEGERKILLDMQGSSSQPDAVRQKIYDRAMGLAERRLSMMRDRATELRGGSYFKPGGGLPAGEAAPAAPAQDGWSDVGSGIKIRRK